MFMPHIVRKSRFGGLTFALEAGIVSKIPNNDELPTGRKEHVACTYWLLIYVVDVVDEVSKFRVRNWAFVGTRLVSR
jgi:hypothetical protein